MAVSTIDSSGLNQVGDTTLCTSSGNLGVGTTPVAMANNPGGLQVNTQTIVQNVVNNQSLIAANAYYSGSWKAVRTQSGYAAMRLNAVGPGISSWHQSSSSYTAGDALPNMDGSDIKMIIDASGNLLVNTTSQVAQGKFGVAFVGASNQAAAFNETSGASSWTTVLFQRTGTTIGSISNATSSTAYNTSSDYRLKNTITPMTGALAKVAQLKPVTYKWNIDNEDGEGFIAHELAEVCPHAVTGAKDAVDEEGNPVYQGIDTGFLVATLTAAIQEQQSLISTLITQVVELQSKVAALENK